MSKQNYSNLQSEIKQAASARQTESALNQQPISRTQALNLASQEHNAKGWLAVRKLARPSDDFHLQLQIMGGQHKPIAASFDDWNKLMQAVQAQLQELANDGDNVVKVDLYRTLRSVILVAQPLQGKAFQLEVSATTFEDAAQKKFLRRLINTVEKQHPRVLFNQGISNAAPHPRAYAEFHLSPGIWGGPRLSNEFALFQTLQENAASRFDMHDGAAMLSTRAGQQRLQIAWHDDVVPFGHGKEDLSQNLMKDLWRRYQRWTAAVETPIRALGERFAARVADDTPSEQRQRAQYIEFSMRAPMQPLLERALGQPFFQQLVQQRHQHELAVQLHAAVRSAIPSHLQALEQAINARDYRTLPFMEKNQLASVPENALNINFPTLDAHPLITYGYWKYAKDVVGDAGRYTAEEFARRVDQHGLQMLAAALNRHAIHTEIPCPVCGQPAKAKVAMLASATSTGAWNVECSCGHAESSSAVPYTPGPGRVTSVPVLNCECASCAAKRKRLMQETIPIAASVGELLDQAVNGFAEQLLKSTRLPPADQELMRQCYETVRYIHPSKRERYGRWTPELRALADAGQRMYSLALQASGFERQVVRKALPPMEEDLKTTYKYAGLRAGFDADDMASFQRWCWLVLEFSGWNSITLPLSLSVWRDAN